MCAFCRYDTHFSKSEGGLNQMVLVGEEEYVRSKSPFWQIVLGWTLITLILLLFGISQTRC